MKNREDNIVSPVLLCLGTPVSERLRSPTNYESTADPDVKERG